MADGEKKAQGNLISAVTDAKIIRANGQDKAGGGWTPERYANMYIYIFLYNKVAGNPRDYGLTLDSNDNTTIYNAVVENIDTLIKNYKIDSLGHLFNKEAFLKDMPNLNQHALEFSNVFGRPTGQMIDSTEADVVMKVKENKCRKAFLAVKGNTDYKDFIGDGKEGGSEKGENGIYQREAMAADRILQQKKAPLRRARWKQFLFGILGVAAAAGTVVGLGALIGGGGALLSGIFGGVFSAGTLGGAAAGAVGMVGGGFLAKTFLGKFIDARAQKLKFKKDYLDYLRGEGKYALKADEKDIDKVSGYRGIKKRLKYAMMARGIYMGYEKWKANHEKNLPPDKRKSNYYNEYKAFVERKYKKYCKLYPNYDEEVKEAIYNHSVADSSGIFRKVQGLLGYQVAAEDRKNTMTVTERIKFAEDLIEKSKFGEASFEDLKQQLLETEKYADYFKSQNSEAAHFKIMNKLAHAIVEKARDVVNKPFDDQTKKLIDDLLEDEQTKKAIQSAGIGGDMDELESLSTFINKETRSFNTELGVTLSEQLNFDRNSLKSGCQRIGIPDADKVAVSKVISDISNMVSQGEFDGINSYIDENISDKKLTNYLKFMLKRQNKRSKAVTEGVDLSVKSDIDNLVDPNNVKAIREKIERLSVPERLKAQQALQAQIDSLNYKKQLDNVTGAYLTLKELKDGKVKKNFETIDAIKYESVNEQDLIVFKGSLAKIQNRQLSEYMQMKLNEKLEKTYLSYAEGKKNTFAGNIDDLRKFIVQVNESKILTESQKSNITGKVSESLGTALRAEIETIPDTLFKSGMTVRSASDAADILSSKYKNYLERTISGGALTGFKEFFDLGTPESEAIKRRLENFRTTVSQVPQFLSASTLIGSQAATFDGDSAEAKKFLKPFYSKDRSIDDPLFKVSKKISNIYQKINDVSKTAFIEPGEDGLTEVLYRKVGDTESGILVDFKKTIDDIKMLDEEDKIAALVVLKTKCVGLFRAQDRKSVV